MTLMNPYKAYAPLKYVPSLRFFSLWQYLTNIKSLSKLLNLYRCDFIVTRYSFNIGDFTIWESIILIPHSIALKRFESVYVLWEWKWILLCMNMKVLVHIYEYNLGLMILKLFLLLEILVYNIYSNFVSNSAIVYIYF